MMERNLKRWVCQAAESGAEENRERRQERPAGRLLEKFK